MTIVRSKTISYGVWHPDIARAHVTIARGIHFTNMGHSVARPTSGSTDGIQKNLKRLELLPEEALYLVERGAMFCWKDTDAVNTSALGLEDMEGAPMSVQQAFAEMICKEDLSLEKYQVRRLSVELDPAYESVLGVCLPEATRICRNTRCTTF